MRYPGLFRKVVIALFIVFMSVMVFAVATAFARKSGAVSCMRER